MVGGKVPFTANACSTCTTVSRHRVWREVAAQLTCSEFSVSSALRFAGALTTDMLFESSDALWFAMGRGNVCIVLS
jgi:hypothetical protein